MKIIRSPKPRATRPQRNPRARGLAKPKLAPAPASPLFASLDFPNRDSVCPSDAARRLGCSVQHVYNLILEGHLHAIDISIPGRCNGRRFARIPIESWRKFLSDRSM